MAGSRITACVTSHGSDLRGGTVAPASARRSPSYLVRQIFDIKSGARYDQGVSPMVAVSAKLAGDDIIAATAYLASLLP